MFLVSELRGGPLGSDVYKMQQWHCHWGARNGEGSEHTVDGRSFSGELHLVHWNTSKYNSFQEAAGQEDGLAVLGVLLMVSFNLYLVDIEVIHVKIKTIYEYYMLYHIKFMYSTKSTLVLPKPVVLCSGKKPYQGFCLRRTRLGRYYRLTIFYSKVAQHQCSYKEVHVSRSLLIPWSGQSKMVLII